MNAELFESINRARQAAGFLSIEDTLALGAGTNNILDPFSILISKGVHLGNSNTIYPGVTIKAQDPSRIRIGNDNVFHSGTLIEAVYGDITIENGNLFGDGGFTAKTNQPGAEIRIGSDGRYMSNPAVYGVCNLQNGSQLLGNITVVSCTLCAGGSYLEPEPDERGGLLKGAGTANGLVIPKGHVIANHGGVFEQEGIVPQSQFHPRKKQ